MPAATTTYAGVGRAEDFQDIIYDISPTETPLLSMAKRVKSVQTLHQWQTDVLDAPATNRRVEGDDATYATHAPTVNLANFQQISTKFVEVSGTYDAVKKYGRKSELAYQLMKAGKALKRDMDFAITRNQISTAGGVTTARSTAGMEAWIAGNRILSTGNSTGTTPAVTTTPGTAITDGTATTFIEADLKLALQAAWVDGGEPSVLLMSATNKNRFDTFAGIATKFHDVSGNSQATTTGAADVYVSSFGNHTVKLSRQMRDQAVLCVDPEYVAVSTLRPIQKEELAKIGDGTRYQLVGEYGLVVSNMDAHAKIQGVGA